jgi:uncharacterized membrane protein
MKQEIITMLVAAAPVSELRGAIPLAIGVFHFSAIKALLLSVVGNIAPVLPLLYFWHKLSKVLSQHLYWANRFFSWLFERTRVRHTQLFTAMGVIGLFIFTAIPLPLTGAWSATIAAFIFDLPLRKSFYAISLGVITAGCIVLIATLGIAAIF